MQDKTPLNASEDLAPPPKEVVAYELHNNCYLNVTWRCTLRCSFCPKFKNIWTVQGYDLRLHNEPDVNEILQAVGDVSRYREVVFCGMGEPTMRLGTIVEVARTLKLQGAKIRLNTDGLANLLYRKDITPKLKGVIDTVSVSMNAQNTQLYDQLCRPALPGAYPAMLDFIQKAKKQVPHVVTTAIDGLPGVDINACTDIATELGVDFRMRYLDVVG